jgi:hypothetical protein
VSTRVGEQDAISGIEHELGEGGDALARVADSVKQDDRIAVGITRLDVPSAQDGSVTRRDGDVLKFGCVLAVDALADCVAVHKRKARRMERAFGEEDCRNDTHERESQAGDE